MFVIGSNTTEAHPIIGTKMKQALARGAKLIVADPREIELARDAHVWMRLNPGTDIALINGIMNIILENGWEDRAFIEERTEGYEQLRENLKKFPPEEVSKITGVSLKLMTEAARLYTSVERAQIFYTLGITEHICGTDNVMSLANLAMLTGNIGKESSGVNPLRGQNNVQGACDMGALPNVYTGYQGVSNPAVQAKFEEAWGVSLNPKTGFMIPDMFDFAVKKGLRAMYIMGEDPVLTDADANHVRKGLGALDFLVVQNIFMSETAELADVILPGASFAEKDGTFTNTERRVQRVNRAIKPIADTKADWEIICEISTRMGYPMTYQSPAEIMLEIASLTPQYAGITFERLGNQGLQWPVPHAEHHGTKYLHQGQFTRGKGMFAVVEHQPPDELPDEEYPFLLTTGRKLQHYNISTRFSAALEEHAPEELAELNPKDAERLGIQDGDQVKVVSRRGEVVTKVWVTDRVQPGVLFMTLHYWESPTNVLTNGAYDKVTKTYEYKACGVRVETLEQSAK